MEGSGGGGVWLQRNLASQGEVHVVAYLFGVETAAKEVHELGECGLDGRVVSADDARLEQLKTSLVESHLDASCAALCDVHNRLS